MANADVLAGRSNDNGHELVHRDVFPRADVCRLLAVRLHQRADPFDQVAHIDERANGSAVSEHPYLVAVRSFRGFAGDRSRSFLSPAVPRAERAIAVLKTCNPSVHTEPRGVGADHAPE